MSFEVTTDERHDFAWRERTFGIAAKWGYDPSAHSRFEARMHEDPDLGLAAQEFTDPLFRNLYRAGAGASLHFVGDVQSKFERQAELSATTRKTLTALVSRYLRENRLVETSLAVMIAATDTRSLFAEGVRAGAAQLLDIGRGDWSAVYARRRQTLEAFSARPDPEAIRDDGDGLIASYAFYISIGPRGVGSSRYPIGGDPSAAIEVGAYDDDYFVDNERWELMWRSYAGDDAPSEEVMAEFAEHLAALSRDEARSISSD